MEEQIQEVIEQIEAAMERIDQAAMNSGNGTVYANNKNLLKELNDIRKKLKKM